MLFNSFPFLLGLLPASLVLFYLSARVHRNLPLAVIIAASLVFYGFWSVGYLFLILASVTVNYTIGHFIQPKKSLLLLGVGICFNLGLLGYFKYTDFLLENSNRFFHTTYLPLRLVLPLGISFHTFQQIAFLVDRRRGLIGSVEPARYLAFVVFFPQLIAGPIVHYREIKDQFARLHDGVFGPVGRNLLIGLAVFSLGLVKKTAVADTFAQYCTPVFHVPEKATSLLAWRAALSYAFQIYFDFSGYVDMALGAARMFGIVLPQNFNSPYKASSIVDFWRRWHITLSLFLRDYLYIPLGGNRHGYLRQLANIMVTMLLGGLWHGASWAFVLWGGLHGGMLVINHTLQRWFPRFCLPGPAAVGLTFLTVVVSWVPFRAESLDRTLILWRLMADIPAALRDTWSSLNGLVFTQLKDPVALVYDQPGVVWCLWAAATLALVWGTRNVSQLAHDLEAGLASGVSGAFSISRWMLFAGVALGVSILLMNSGRISEFIYFQF